MISPCATFPGFRAKHAFFFYDTEISFHALRSTTGDASHSATGKMLVGYSGTPANNHASALKMLNGKTGISEVIMPVSYGDHVYISRLKAWVGKQRFTFKVTFLEHFQPFEQYLDFVNSCDAIVLNALRPAGLGNFWIGIFLGKKLFLNEKNLAFQDLKSLGISFFSMNLADSPENLTLGKDQVDRNRTICLDFFSEEHVRPAYISLFS
jgi:hypothetical protein